MSKWALYHDFDELKCETVREAIKARAITDGEVVCGDIKQLTADDVRGFRRVHFFCGGGFWDLALNLAGWGDEPVWTGSCPCPSFSCAGKGGGFDDPRHLWPDWFRLIGECRPAAVFGEQADDAVGYGWLDLVQTDLEAQAYAVGKVVLGAHSVGAPHIRQRLYFCADTAERRWIGRRPGGESIGNEAAERRDGEFQPERSCHAGDCTNADGGQPRDGDVQRGGEQRLLAQDCGTGDASDLQGDGRSEGRTESARQQGRLDDAERGGAIHSCDAGGAGSSQLGRRRLEPSRSSAPGFAVDGQFTGGEGLQGHAGLEYQSRGPGWLDPEQARSIAATGATRGFWAGCDWWYGRDGKYRPIGPGLQPLASRSSPDVVLVPGGGQPDITFPATEARTGRLRLYGDAICVETAKAFIEAYRESRGM